MLLRRLGLLLEHRFKAVGRRFVGARLGRQHGGRSSFELIKAQVKIVIKRFDWRNQFRLSLDLAIVTHHVLDKLRL